MHAPILFNVQNIFPIDAGILHKLPIKGLKGIPYKILRKMQRDAYLMSDSLVTISDDMRQTLIDEKVPEKKIIVIYNWSYSDDPNDILDEENLFLKAHPEVKDFFRVVFAGNIGAMVNPNIIAEAAEKLKHYERIKFIMIGDGNNLPRLKELSKEKKLSNMIFFPYQPEEFAPHNYAMAHVNINALPKGIIKTCMPSKTATMLNSAKPMVVAVDLNSEYSKLLQRIDKCSVVDWNDNEGFASSIKNIYLSSSKQKSNNSRLLFVNYCSTKNAKQYLETLIDISKKN